ncbi:hypothetical protein Aduo_005376 [Ancylostoma duodenale]
MELRGVVNHYPRSLSIDPTKPVANKSNSGWLRERGREPGEKRPSKMNQAREFDCLCARVRRSCVTGRTRDVTALERGSSRALDEKKPVRDAL